MNIRCCSSTSDQSDVVHQWSDVGIFLLKYPTFLPFYCHYAVTIAKTVLCKCSWYSFIIVFDWCTLLWCLFLPPYNIHFQQVNSCSCMDSNILNRIIRNTDDPSNVGVKLKFCTFASCRSTRWTATSKSLYHLCFLLMVVYIQVLISVSHFEVSSLQG